MNLTKSQQKSIIERVTWIHRNREKEKAFNLEVSKIKADMQKVAAETLNIIDFLKRDMGTQTTMNIKVEDKYYTLTQNAAGVDIQDLIITIDLK